VTTQSVKPGLQLSETLPAPEVQSYAPGWYEQSDGSNRYYDGNGWTSHIVWPDVAAQMGEIVLHANGLVRTPSGSCLISEVSVNHELVSTTFSSGGSRNILKTVMLGPFIATAIRRNDKVNTTHAALVTVSGPTFVYTEWFEMTAGVAFSSWANTWARSAAHHAQP
jgi:hypothetical protein